MKTKSTSSMLAFFVTLSASALLLSSCGKVDQIETPAEKFPVSESALTKASTTSCLPSEKLRPSTIALDEDFNNLVATGRVKALAFRLGFEKCALKFTTYDLITRLSSTAGTFTSTTLTGSTNTYFYQILMPNSDATSCIENGSLWQVETTTSTNTNRTQIILKGVSETSNPTLALESDKLARSSALAEKIGMTAYTCQRM